jgi:hypothetical protein
MGAAPSSLSLSLTHIHIQTHKHTDTHMVPVVPGGQGGWAAQQGRDGSLVLPADGHVEGGLALWHIDHIGRSLRARQHRPHHLDHVRRRRHMQHCCLRHPGKQGSVRGRRSATIRRGRGSSGSTGGGGGGGGHRGPGLGQGRGWGQELIDAAGRAVQQETRAGTVALRHAAVHERNLGVGLEVINIRTGAHEGGRHCQWLLPARRPPPR